ncbi:MAG: tRNA (cytidine(34)-2'-O)-methyltransferase [Phycisphaerae bacterium]|nr:tRNA (cytidine(34)-2'-O)-methyltransferase [Phycisphaerae bacterium]
MRRFFARRASEAGSGSGASSGSGRARPVVDRTSILAPHPAGTPARSGPRPLFHVVLHEPQIPNNTGNIGRTCVATGCSLHLIHPLGFRTDEKACRRAGLDYWPRLNVREHPSYEAFAGGLAGRRPWYLTTRSPRSVFDVELLAGDFLVFGNESSGLPERILSQAGERAVSLPMVPAERSLNLATVVCAVVFEGVRQLIGKQIVFVQSDGRLGHGPLAKNASPEKA